MTWPEGHVTILFTDVESSTAMARSVGDDVYREVLRAPHNRVIREAVSRVGGHEVGTPAGDSFMLVFETADAALACALGIQHALAEQPLQSGKWTLRVRIGIHTAEVPLKRSEGGEYVSSEVSLAARVEALATGGQILLSTSARRSLTGGAEMAWQKWPNKRLRGVDRLETLFEPLWDGLSRGEPGVEGRPLHERARALWEAGRWADARERLEEALDVMRGNADRPGEGVALANLGVLGLRLRDFGAAVSRLTEALAIAQELGDRELEARVRSNLGLAWRGQGRYEPAERELRQALRLCQEVGDAGRSARLLLRLGRLHGEEGLLQRAARDLAESRDLAAQRGLPAVELEALHEAGLVALAEERPDRAERFLQEGLALAGPGPWQARIQASLGLVARRLGDPVRAERHLHAALEAADEPVAVRALLSLGAMRLESGDGAGARGLLERSLERAERLGDEVCAALAQADLALVERLEGRLSEALALAAAAADRLQAAGDLARAGRVRRWMQAWTEAAAPVG